MEQNNAGVPEMNQAARITSGLNHQQPIVALRTGVPGGDATSRDPTLPEISIGMPVEVTSVAVWDAAEENVPLQSHLCVICSGSRRARRLREERNAPEMRLPRRRPVAPGKGDP